MSITTTVTYKSAETLVVRDSKTRTVDAVCPVDDCHEWITSIGLNRSGIEHCADRLVDHLHHAHGTLTITYTETDLSAFVPPMTVCSADEDDEEAVVKAAPLNWHKAPFPRTAQYADSAVEALRYYVERLDGEKTWSVMAYETEQVSGVTVTKAADRRPVFIDHHHPTRKIARLIAEHYDREPEAGTQRRLTRATVAAYKEEAAA